MAGTRAGWRSPPFETLGELLMHRWQDIDRIDPLQQQRQSQADPEGAAPPALTRLQIDLASDNGARDAWWADDLVSRALLQRPAGASGAGKGVLTRLELRPLPSPHTSGSLPRPLQPGVPA
jgi:hypothetical protein